jgi:hypothetical protein
MLPGRLWITKVNRGKKYTKTCASPAEAELIMSFDAEKGHLRVLKG